MLNSAEVAERIKARSKELNIQLKDVFEQSGLNKNMIAGMRNGSMPKADNLAKIAEQLHCSVDYLLGQPPTQDSFVERLREALGDMSCEEFAQKFDGDAKVLSLYLDGKRKPSKVSVFFIATCLNVNPDWLEGLDVPKYKEPTPKDGDGPTENAQRFMLLIDGLTPIQLELLRSQLQAWNEQNQRQALADQELDEERDSKSES